MALDLKKLYALGNRGKLHFCDVGMDLAEGFLGSCVDAVDHLEFVDDASGLNVDFILRWGKLADHWTHCPKCHEDECSNNYWLH